MAKKKTPKPARTEAEIVSEVRKLDRRDDSERTAYDAARKARESAESCARCRKAIAPGEPVWIGLFRYTGFFGNPSRMQTAFCGECRKQLRFHPNPFPCVTCGRDVYLRVIPNRRYVRLPIACSDACRYARRLATIRHPRRTLTLTCPVCGKAFQAARENARTCGPTCRQKARRQRMSQVDYVQSERCSPPVT